MISNRWLACLQAAVAVSLAMGSSERAMADVNVAPTGVATQSTEAFGGAPGRAIDGNTDGNYGGGSVTHTADGDGAPSWQVDLGEEVEISSIVLWNRTDCCSERLTNFRISILDAALIEVEGEDFFTDLTFPSPSFTWTLPAAVDGQVVRIELIPRDPPVPLTLSLAEVEVFSPATDLEPFIVTQPRGGKSFAGGSFTFTVEAVGGEPLAYKWFRGPTELAGQTASTLTLDPLSVADSGDYTVEVRNAAGAVTSDPAALRVFNGRNLARDGEASQSTTGYEGVAGRANDGNTSGNYGASTVSHTNDGDPAPWWEVTLYGPSTVETVFIWNRTDCCSNRLNNFRVSVLDLDRNELFSEDFFTAGDGTFPDTSADGFEVPVGAVGASFVRVELLGDLLAAGFFLSLAEVEVIGVGPTPPPDPNLAVREGANATQSSEHNGGQFPADLARNKILDDFTHTGAGQNLPATWEVNLGAENDIEEIVVWNRRNCCGSRLRDIIVSVLSLDGATTLFESDLLNPENELGVFPNGPEKLVVNLFELTGGFIKGGRVRVVRIPDEDLSGTGGQGNADEMDVLSLAEVQVFTPIECPAQGDTHCTPLFFEITGPDGGGPGVYRVQARGRDDSGDIVKYTFVADNGRDPPTVLGPQSAPEANILLGVQDWTISVTVDDNLRCDDLAADATCSDTLSIAGKPGNKAPYGVATQSSEGYGGAPGRAIDGITNGVYGAGSVTHTADGDPAPWWEVDLAESTPITSVVLWNRTDGCCMQRLTNFRVSILAADRSEMHAEDLFTDFSFPDTTVEGFEIPIPGGTEGKIVRIELLSGGWLSLAEVEVFCPTGPTETNCSDGADDDGDGDIDCADTDCASSPGCAGAVFHRGDADDNGVLQLTDAVRILGFLFLGQTAPTCLDASDADDNGVLQLTDAVRVLGFLFLGQTPPAPPGPPDGSTPCGTDPTAEDPDLGCASYTGCGA